MIRLYNTRTKEKDSLPRTSDGSVRLFVCGPTVYAEPHIGNMRTFMFFDLLVRFLRSEGVSVSYIQNITDVDDKIILRAAEAGVSWDTLSKQYTDLYLQDLTAFGMDQIDKHLKATDYIPELLSQIERLIEKNHVYKIDGEGWYFDLSTVPTYGKLAGRTTLQAEDAVSRIDESTKKRNAGDFAVWKFSKPGEPVWEAPLGDGRPGWHIEDTAISEAVFGLQYELHGGGTDLLFPHHEAEVTIAESLSGTEPFVELWMHPGHLTVDGKRMGKSNNNFMTASDFLTKHPPELLRMLSLMTHYRARFDYNEHAVHTAKMHLQTIQETLLRLAFVREQGTDPGATTLSPESYMDRLREALADDFNSPQALTVLSEFLSEANKVMYTLSRESARALHSTLTEILTLFGFPLPTHETPEAVTELLKQRELSRNDEQFTQADALRSEIEGLGYVVEDTPLGPIVFPR